MQGSIILHAFSSLAKFIIISLLIILRLHNVNEVRQMNYKLRQAVSRETIA